MTVVEALLICQFTMYQWRRLESRCLTVPRNQGVY